MIKKVVYDCAVFGFAASCLGALITLSILSMPSPCLSTKATQLASRAIVFGLLSSAVIAFCSCEEELN
jgi:hypothetical protein